MIPVLTAREINPSDVPFIVSYWVDSDPAFLQSMGVDLEKLPTRESLETVLQKQIETPLEEKRSYCIIWEADNQPIGHCNTNPTYYGEEAYMHLHLWDKAERKKGTGLQLLKITVPIFFKNLQLNTLYCEPYALNEAPNKTLERLGFDLEKEYTTIPGSINFEQPVKRWVLSRAKFDSIF